MFDRLIGNKNAAAAVERMIAAGRLPHSLLLAGPEGVGKREFAFEIAKSLVCSAEPRPCGNCAACRRAEVFSIPRSDKKEDFEQVLSSEHPDVGRVVPYKRNILVNAIRDLEREANFRPFEAGARVFIIDDADRMNEAASNALLKTLEEPPATTYIILVAARPDRLLTTIRSRCQTIRFSPVAAREIEDLLLKTQRFTPADAALAARVSRGSVGRALEMDVAAFKASRELMLDVLAAAIERRDIGGMLQVSEQLADAKNKDRFEVSLEILEMLIRDAIVLRSGGEIVNEDVRKVLERLAGSADVNRLSSWIREIETINENLQVNVNKRITADALFVQMAG